MFNRTMRLFKHCLNVGFVYVEFICTQWLGMFLLIGLFLCVGCARHLCAQHWHKSRCKQTIENMKQSRKLIRRDKQIIHLIVFWWYLFRVGRIFSLIRFFGSFQVYWVTWNYGCHRTDCSYRKKSPQNEHFKCCFHFKRCS